MTYTFNMGIWSSVFAVPSALVDKHLKLAGKEQLKVILWILRHAGESFSLERAGKALGLPDDIVEDCILYWKDSGILSEEGTQSNNQPMLQAEKTSPEPVPATAPLKKRLVKPGIDYVSQRIKESEDIRSLMQDAQNILGKTLSPAMSSTLVCMHEDYGLPVEVILVMLHYTKSIGKTGTAYLDALSRNWSESGVLTLTAADAKIQELDQRRLAWKKVESATGISHRAPGKREEEAAHCWLYKWKMTDKLISLAYERCAENTGKFSYKYMNTILESWYNQGIKNEEQIISYEEKNKNSSSHPNSYDIDEYSETGFFDPIED